MTKPYIVSVDFNFEGQSNKYKTELDTLKKSLDYREAQARGVDTRTNSNKAYDFKCTFPGVVAGDILVVKCATGYQVVKATAVRFPDTIPDHATARIIAKLDLVGIENMEAKAAHYEELLFSIEAEARRVAERKHYKKLAKQSPHLAELVALKELMEDS